MIALSMGISTSLSSNQTDGYTDTEPLFDIFSKFLFTSSPLLYYRLFPRDCNPLIHCPQWFLNAAGQELVDNSPQYVKTSLAKA